VIEVALQQRGGPAARAAAQRALAKDRNTAGGVIRVLVRELDATTEHAVFLGAEVRH
jgi:DNA-binding transcriptional regulator YdaS (Cro superfamily)